MICPTYCFLFFCYRNIGRHFLYFEVTLLPKDTNFLYTVIKLGWDTATHMEIVKR